MADFKVTEVLNAKLWSKDGGEPTVIYYDFKAEGQDKICNIGRKPSNPLKVGDVIEATAEEDRGKLKLKAVQKQFGGSGGGYKGKSDEEKRAENMRSALHAAKDYLIAVKQAGEPVASTHVDQLANRWYTLIEKAANGS